MENLYNGTPPFERSSATSRAAAERIRKPAAAMREAVFRAILAAGARGVTDDEVEVVTGFRHQSASARRRELFLLGRIADTGGVRKTRSGRNATVWRVKAVEAQPQLF